MNATAFINLPVRDLARASEFFAALGFTGPPPAPDGASAQLTLGGAAQLILHRDLDGHQWSFLHQAG